MLGAQQKRLSPWAGSSLFRAVMQGKGSNRGGFWMPIRNVLAGNYGGSFAGVPGVSGGRKARSKAERGFLASGHWGN